MSKRTYPQWLSTLGPTVCGIRVEIGAKNQGGGTAGICAIAGRDLELAESVHVPTVCEFAELAETIRDIANGAGWPEEERRMRLYALDKAGRNLTSFQKTEKPGAKPEEITKSDTVIMFEQMATMMARQLSTIEKLVATQSGSIEQLSDANNHALTTTMHMMDAMIEAKEYAAETAAHTAVLEHAIENAEGAEPNGGYLELAKDALAAVVGGGGHDEPDITAEDVARKAAEDPFFASDLKSAMNPESEDTV